MQHGRSLLQPMSLCVETRARIQQGQEDLERSLLQLLSSPSGICTRPQTVSETNYLDGVQDIFTRIHTHFCLCRGYGVYSSNQ